MAAFDKVGRDRRGMTLPMLGAGGGISVTDKRRARRFELQSALRYRTNGDGHWSKGITRNISYSGVLFHGEDWTEPGTHLEMSLVLPRGISGEWVAEVVCRGTVMRAERSGSDEGGPLIASRISHYRFVRP